MTASWRAATFAPFKSRTFFWIWAASLISYCGTLIQAVGASWLMTSIAPSPDMVALVQASAALPILLLSLPAGAIADIADHRIIMLIAQGAMWATSVALTLIVHTGHITPWILLCLTFLIGCGGALHGPAWQASVGEQVRREDIPAAVSLNSLAFNVARTAGPAIGGVIVATAGPPVAFLVNALSYVAMIIVLGAWRREKHAPSLPPEPMQMAMQAGLRYVLHSPAIHTILVRGLFFGLLGSSVLALMPLIARDLLAGGASTYGVLFAGFGVGAMTGSLMTTLIREGLSNHAVITSGSLLFGVTTAAVAFSSYVALTVALLLLSGMSWVLMLSTLNITVQISSPRWVLGRAIAIYQMVIFGGLAGGSWLFGEIAKEYSIRISLVAAGGAMVLLALVGFKLRLPRADNLQLDPFRSPLTPPHVGLDVVPQSGPVVTMIEYQIAAEDRDAFMMAMRDMRQIRRRNGAQRWTLLQDIDDLSRWTERFQCPTWLEYLRQRQRLTESDREVTLKVQAFHRSECPLRVRHQLERTPTAASNGKIEAERIRERASVVDPYLPPVVMPAAREAGSKADP